LKVACVETRKTLGGTCLNVGCIPSKALLHATALYETTQKEFPAMGLKATVKADIPAMIESKDKIVAGLTQGIEYLVKSNPKAKSKWTAKSIKQKISLLRRDPKLQLCRASRLTRKKSSPRRARLSLRRSRRTYS